MYVVLPKHRLHTPAIANSTRVSSDSSKVSVKKRTIKSSSI